MKTINGVNYLSIGETAKLVDRSAQTIKNWFKWCSAQGVEPNQVGLPEYRRDLDGKGTYHFKEEDIPALIDFRDSISYGQMSDFNITRWGQRGREIEARKVGQEGINEQAATSL